ncbi:hypothetical protein METSCH_C06390 [Metschnikowia aff. pulcherrima]|uniref:Uncharacterized protein n=1 Tax=Metschnikowia aff. pulcherrima TaxID=2163413 RepID=A0A4P6XML0_9ASCO|nr:hypothetical protein METSCH_C06390 [Metschnikowia aff. pulcherrima]
MLPGLFLNGLVQIAFFCSLALAVNTESDGAGQTSDSGNALTKSRPEYTKFNKFFIERSYGKKFTGEETPITPKSPENSTASELPEAPESQKVPEVQNQVEKEKNSDAPSNSTPAPPVPVGKTGLEPKKEVQSEKNQVEKEKDSNVSSGSAPVPVVPGGETVLEPDKQASSEQIQLEKVKESNTTSSSITAPAIFEGEKVLKPENQSEINRPEDEIKTGNSTNIEPTDSELKQMNDSSGKGVANEETTLRKSTGTLSPQNATCPDINLILAELNQEAPLLDKGVDGEDASFNALSAEIASKYASCPDIDVVLVQLNRTEPKGNTHGFVQDLQGQKKLSMTENKEVSPQAETESGRAEARVLGDDTVLSKPASGNAKENVEGHVNLSASARMNVNDEVPMLEPAKVSKAPMEKSEPAEGKHVSDMSPPILNDSSSRLNQEASDAVIQGNQAPEETSTLTTTLTKYVYAPETSTLWNTHTSTVCDENSPCATAPAEQSQGPRNEAIIDSPEPVRLTQATDRPHMPLSVQREDDSKAEKADAPDQTTDLTFTTTITSTVMSKPMSTYNSTIVLTTCSNATDCTLVKTIRPMSGHVPAPKPIVAYEGKASSLTLGGAMMGVLGLVCVFI